MTGGHSPSRELDEVAQQSQRLFGTATEVRAHGSVVDECKVAIQPGGAAMAAPQPFGGALAEAGADRVSRDVTVGAEHVPIRFHWCRGIAVASKVPRPTVPRVELLRIWAVESMHTRLQEIELHVEKQVVMGRHQAEGAARPAEAKDRSR